MNMRNGNAFVPRDGEQIDIAVRRGKGKNEEPKADEPAADEKLRSLFDRLGGSGRIVVNRVRDDDGKSVYCGSIQVKDGLAETLEETLAVRFGGGDYQLSGYHGSKYIGFATVAISPEIKPRRAAQEERPAVAPQPAEKGFDFMQWIAFSAEREEKARQTAMAQAQLQQQQQQQMFLTMMQLMETSSARTMAVMQTFAAAVGGHNPAQPGQPNGIDQVMQAVSLVEKIKSVSGGDAQQFPPETTMTERVLGMIAQPIASKVGDVIADSMKAKPPQSPVTVAPPPVLPLPLPVAGPSPVAPPVTPPTPRAAPGAPPAMPMPPRNPVGKTPLQGARVLTAEQIKERQRVRIEAGNGAAGNVVRPAIAPAQNVDTGPIPSEKK